jgi:NAD(P)-dependent dehydrogenase (short-subunit alcohol dehydrogenase family)
VRLEGQAALITGASRGLGLAIARKLSAEGAAVACMARPGAELDRAVAGLVAGGARAIAAPADVTREAEVSNAVEAAGRALGDLDILILNAGTWRGAPLHETTEQMWDSLLDLNLKGAFLPLKHALPRMIARRRGTIVGISSIGGKVGQPGSAAYAASKWGLRGLLESAALEVKPHGIRVSVIYPHMINSAGPALASDSPDRERRLEPGEIADLVAFVCAAPRHVSFGNLDIWPLNAGIRDKMW